jgi:Mrp family chromosome partitioning ATPase
MDPVPYSRHLSVVSIGFLLRDGNEAVIWRGPRKFGLIRQFLADVEWGDLDFLVIDSPPGTGDEPLAACELTAGDPAEGRQNDRGAVVVTTPQSVAINDVRKCVRFCRELALPIHGVIENMSGLTCPHCGGQIDVFLRGGGEAMAGDLDVPFLGRIPLEPAIVESGERGRPHVLETLLGEHDGEPHASAAAFEAIARRILKRDYRSSSARQAGRPTRKLG